VVAARREGFSSTVGKLLSFRFCFLALFFFPFKAFLLFLQPAAGSPGPWQAEHFKKKIKKINSKTGC
jgi:hypothetical protein